MNNPFAHIKLSDLAFIAAMLAAVVFSIHKVWTAPERPPLPTMTLEQRADQVARCKAAGLNPHEVESARAIVEIRCVVPGTRNYFKP